MFSVTHDYGFDRAVFGSKINQFEECLKNGELEKAKALLPSLGIFDQDHAAVKIFNAYLNDGKLKEAEAVISRIGLFNQSFAIERLADAYICRDELRDAERVISQLLFPFTNQQYRSLFDAYLKRQDWESAKRIASNMVDRSCMLKVLDHELQSKDSTSVMNTLVKYLPMNEKAAQKVADKLIANKDKFTIKDLQQFEKASNSLWRNARILILKALIAIYQTLGNQTEVDRLQAKVQGLEKVGDDLQREGSILAGGALGTFVGSVLFPLTPYSPLIGGVTGAALLGSFPSLRKPEILTGALYGTIAYKQVLSIPAVNLSTGIPTAVAVAVGLSGAMIARLVCNPGQAETALIKVGKVAETSMQTMGRIAGATLNAAATVSKKILSA